MKTTKAILDLYNKEVAPALDKNTSKFKRRANKKENI